MMRFLRSLFLLGLLAAAVPLSAQTADQARLIFSLGVGVTSKTSNFWRVGAQPFQVQSGIIDTLSVERDFRSSLNVILSGTYFPGDHLGFNVEAQLLGLATEDNCRIRQTSGALETSDVCS